MLALICLLTRRQRFVLVSLPRLLCLGSVVATRDRGSEAHRAETSLRRVGTTLRRGARCKRRGRARRVCDCPPVRMLRVAAPISLLPTFPASFRPVLSYAGKGGAVHTDTHAYVHICVCVYARARV